MSLVGAKNRAGLPGDSLEELLDGQATAALANSVWTSVGLVQGFLDGDVKPGMAAAIGIPGNQVEELRDRLGPQGARGFLLGLAWEREE